MSAMPEETNVSPMNPAFVQSLVRLFRDLVQADDAATDVESTAIRVALLQTLKKRAGDQLTKLEAPLRNQIQKIGSRFESKSGAKGVEWLLGDVLLKRYDDKHTTSVSAPDPQPVAALLTSKGIDTEGILIVSTRVDVAALIGLQKLGQITQEELDAVTTKTRNVNTGSFKLTITGELAAMLEQMR